MKSIASPRLAALAIAVAMLTASCTEGPAGIFSRVADEKPTNANMTEEIKYATPSFVARLGTTYYAGIGTLWTKAAGANAWTNSAIVPGVSASSVLAGSGCVAGSRLYVLFSDAATGSGLGVWSTADGSTWTQVAAGLPSGQYVRAVLAANDQLFAVTVATAADLTESYSLYHYNGAAFESAGISANSDIGIPDSAAYAGSAYWFTAGGYLLSGSTPTTIAKVTGPNDWATGSTVGATLSPTYGGVCAVGATGILLSGTDGKLYYSTDGSAWSGSTAAYVNASSKVFSFSAPTYVDDGTSRILVVGTYRQPRASGDTPPIDGYLEFDLTTTGFSPTMAAGVSHGITADAVNFSASLSAKSVSGMPLVDLGSGEYRLFAMTDGQGLWSDSFAGGAWSGWVRE
ncbi:MAG: hypothetical protein KKA67_13675 [Spirochaetes bacterium]|nr:hypothetical protein [Spirochaetota bacterium]MBU1080670.1 hypothetical protein [Spirochaetota bacterium]